MIRKTKGASHRKIETRGCVDLGSSYFRLLVATGRFPDPAALGDEEFESLSVREDRRYAGWGADLVAGGAVRPPTCDRALVALAGVLETAREAGCARPAIVGTNTLRAAKNASVIVERIERETGLAPRVLTQREEAALGFLGAAFFAGRPAKAILVDMGGTSTEVAWGSGTTMEGFTGLPVGTHTAHAALEAAGSGDPFPAAIASRLETFDPAKAATEASEYSLPQGIRDSTILVTGGTATALAMTLRWMRGIDPPFDMMQTMALDDLAGLRRFIADLHRSGRESSLPFDADRIRLLPAGAMLLESLLRRLDASEFAVTVRDLRWGVVLGGRGYRQDE